MFGHKNLVFGQPIYAYNQNKKMGSYQRETFVPHGNFDIFNRSEKEITRFLDELDLQEKTRKAKIGNQNARAMVKKTEKYTKPVNLNIYFM